MSNPIVALKSKAMSAAKNVDRTSPRERHGAAQNSPLEPAPCGGCGSPDFWIDVYRGVHCRGCDPPSAPSLVARIVRVVGEPGQFTWWSTDEAGPRGARDELDGDDHGDDELQSFDLAGDRLVRAVAARSCVDPARVRSPGGRYSPPPIHGPVGDMTLDEWFESLPLPDA